MADGIDYKAVQEKHEREEIHKHFSEIADLAEGLNSMLAQMLDGQSEGIVVDCVLKKIVELAEVFV